jgi:hypothetical protein
MKPGQGRELLQGAIDLHMHTHPALFPRPHDDVEVARFARDLGMRAIVVKNHHHGTAARAYYAQKAVPGIQVFGALALNTYVGGLNPHAVESEVRYGARCVWMPTITAANHIKYFGGPGFSSYEVKSRPVEGITVLGPDGKLVPQVHEICEIVAAADVILGTAHLDHAEIRALVPAARAAGVRKVVVTHANFQVNDIPVAMCKELVAQGAIIEYCYLPISPVWYNHSPKELAGWIRELGPENVVLSTDVGNYFNPPAPEAFRLFLETMLTVGLRPEELITMAHRNPALLLGLEG